MEPPFSPVEAVFFRIFLTLITKVGKGMNKRLFISKNFPAGVLFFGLQFAFASSVTVDLNEEHQVIRGFGGMVHNTWQGGKGLSETDADLAFGSGDGQLGLTVLRIPVNESSSDFGKELQAAKYAEARGAIVFATPWNPPSSMLSNRHVAASQYQAYTDHLNSFAEYMKNQGAPLYAISFQNEPDWCNEWTCWTADEIYNYTKSYADQLRKNGTKVISAESFAYQKTLYNKVLNDANALKNWDILGAHFYASTAASADSWFEYALADQKNVERWMTEHYTESQGSANYWRKVMVTGDQATASTTDTVRALDVGYEIHRGLVNGNFSEYTWWYIRRCYGLIMETDASGKLTIPSSEVGKVSKRGYVLSQYARFVRPGAIRVGATAKPESNVFVSAYKSNDSVIVVLLNRDYGATKAIDISIPGATSITSFTKYTTSETKNVQNDGEVAATNGKLSITLDKESITTLVGCGPQVVIPQEPYTGTALKIPGKIETENYDLGGSSKAYKDNDSENKGGKYREDGVDIVAIDSTDETKGYAVGYTNAGEWMEYTVNVKTAGEYNLSAQVSSGADNSSIQLFLDDSAITDTIKVPNGGNWISYSPVTAKTTKLSTGEHILKLAITGSSVNIDWLEFGDGITGMPSLLNLSTENNDFTYKIFSIQGRFIKAIQFNKSADAQVLQMELEKSDLKSGVYIIKGVQSNSFMINVQK